MGESAISKSRHHEKIKTYSKTGKVTALTIKYIVIYK
jgi:hypothetical protein